MAKRIGLGESPWRGSPGVYPAQVTRALRFLVEAGVLAEGGDGGQYRYVQPLFADYVRELTE